MSSAVTEQQIEQMSRPDSELPPDLRHEQIREVRDVSAWSRHAYQIVFDQHFLPYSYWRGVPDQWEMTYARVEWHKQNGFFGFLFPKKECITIVVTRKRETWLDEMRNKDGDQDG